ncbi:MAG: heavy metal-binding domain-containing protein [Vicinamibacterales bacterium]
MKIFRTLSFALIVALMATIPSGTSARQAAAELFTCSMHPHVLDTKAGTCSVCSMALKARAMTPVEKELVDFLKAYDAAFLAKDLAKLASMYTPETIVYEGSGINRGWKNYSETHLGPELKSFENLEFGHANVVPHVLGDNAAYVTADYTIKAKMGERTLDSGGLATFVLSKDAGSWKIRHTSTAARRRPAGGV